MKLLEIFYEIVGNIYLCFILPIFHPAIARLPYIGLIVLNKPGRNFWNTIFPCGHPGSLNKVKVGEDGKKVLKDLLLSCAAGRIDSMK